MDNCTLVSNQCLIAAVSIPSVRNTISEYNQLANWNLPLHDDREVLNNCTTPDLARDGCISADPLFADIAQNDYRLTATSPCVDAGTNYWTYTNTITRHVQIDFGAIPSTGNWNNITNLDAGTKIENLTSTNGAGTEWSVRFTQPFVSFHDSAPIHKDVTYPATAYSDSIAIPFGQTNEVVFSGLNPDAEYDFVFLACATTGLTNVRWKSPEETYTANGWGMTPTITSHTPRVTSVPVSPTAEGEIHILVWQDNSYFWERPAPWSTFELIEHDTLAIEQPLTHQLDLAHTHRVLNGAPDIGAYEYSGNLAPIAVAAHSGHERRAGYSVVFTGAESSDIDGSIQQYSWDFGDGTFSNSPSETVTHTYASPGFQTVTLVVTDNDGQTGLDTLPLDVQAAVPSAPSHLVAAETNTEPLSVELQWQDESAHETGFRVERTTRAYPPVDFIVDDTDPRMRYFDGALFVELRLENQRPIAGKSRMAKQLSLRHLHHL